MARNKMEDLRNHLFAALERLSEEEITPEILEMEIKRADAIKDVASQIIQSAKVEVDFVRATGIVSTDSQLFSSVWCQKKIG